MISNPDLQVSLVVNMLVCPEVMLRFFFYGARYGCCEGTVLGKKDVGSKFVAFWPIPVKVAKIYEVSRMSEISS